MNEFDKIVAYGRELGLDYLNVDTLIASHRAMRNAVKSDQKLWLDMLEVARKNAFQEALDSAWIRIDDLKKMSVKELANLVGDE